VHGFEAIQQAPRKLWFSMHGRSQPPTAAVAKL
jgi:hypothetical protein